MKQCLCIPHTLVFSILLFSIRSIYHVHYHLPMCLLHQLSKIGYKLCSFGKKPTTKNKTKQNTPPPKKNS